MAYFFSPIGNTQIVDANGDPLVGGTISTFLAGTSTAETTYTDDTGGTPQGVVMDLNSLGYPENGPVWMLGGVPLKFIIKNAAGVTQSTFDDVSGISDTATTADQWILYGAEPTYISATSFSVVGDQTNTFEVNRRLKSTNSGGTVYSTIVSASFAAGVTTITVTNTSGVLDSGMSAVSYGLLTADNPAIPETSIGKAVRIAASEAAALSAVGGIHRSYLAGCTMSTAGSSATMSIAAGQAADSTNAVLMNLSAIAKTTSAWSVGTAAGGLDTGTIANSTWYHFYVIRRPDTGVVDVVFSTSASSPTLPANYTQYRRIGSGKTNGSAQWTSFTQDGDYFRWAVGILDINATNPGTSSVSATLTVPTGVNVEALMQVILKQTTTVTLLYLRDLAATDEAVSSSAAPLASIGSDTVSGALIAGTASIRTNTSAQIGYRLNTSDGSVIVRIVTAGWVDSRGRNA